MHQPYLRAYHRFRVFRKCPEIRRRSAQNPGTPSSNRDGRPHRRISDVVEPKIYYCTASDLHASRLSIGNKRSSYRIKYPNLYQAGLERDALHPASDQSVSFTNRRRFLLYVLDPKTRITRHGREPEEIGDRFTNRQPTFPCPVIELLAYPLNFEFYAIRACSGSDLDLQLSKRQSEHEPGVTCPALRRMLLNENVLRL